MSTLRRSHVTKTTVERQEYIQNYILPKQEPTADTALRLDTTADEAPGELEQPTHRTASRRGPIALAGEWLRENLLVAIVSTVGAIALTIVGYLWLTVFGLNRELGESRQQIQQLQQNLTDIKTEAAAAEGRINKAIEKVEGRLDRVDERIANQQRAPVRR